LQASCLSTCVFETFSERQEAISSRTLRAVVRIFTKEET
jgi:hypothetical protein